MSDYTNNAQQRILAAVVILAGHEAEGLAPSQLATGLRTTPSNVTRDLANLKEAGFAEQLANGNWRLGPKPVQIALAFQRGLADLKARHDEITNRYTREPK